MLFVDVGLIVAGLLYISSIANLSNISLFGFNVVCLDTFFDADAKCSDLYHQNDHHYPL